MSTTLCQIEGSKKLVCWHVAGIFGGQGVISDGLVILRKSTEGEDVVNGGCSGKVPSLSPVGNEYS